MKHHLNLKMTILIEARIFVNHIKNYEASGGVSQWYAIRSIQINGESRLKFFIHDAVEFILKYIPDARLKSQDLQYRDMKKILEDGIRDDYKLPTGYPTPERIIFTLRCLNRMLESRL